MQIPQVWRLLKHQALPEELRNNSSSKGMKKNNILPLLTMSNVCILLNEYFQHTRETTKKQLIVSCKPA